MKILSATQIRELDAYTIRHQPIASIDLMERASSVFVDWFCRHFEAENQKVFIFCGIGNNGGDGLAIARLLYRRFYTVSVYLCNISENRSEDFEKNLERLPGRGAIPLSGIDSGGALPVVPEDGLIIDAIFGSGLSRPLGGYWEKLVLHLNRQKAIRVAVDIPSGLYADQHTAGCCFEADHTFSFELPKLAFFFPENAGATGQWHFASIGLAQAFIEGAETKHYYLTEALVRGLLKKRNKFDHKGSYGHALIIAGSKGKTGAAILAARAALRSGAGLLSVQVPASSYPILQIALPEAMTIVDPHEDCFSSLTDLTPYRAIGAGCGLGTSQLSHRAFRQLLKASRLPLVLDADALNMLAADQELLSSIPAYSILTPHPGEFKRLFGECSDDFARNERQSDWAIRLKCYIVLKGAHTCVAFPDGRRFYNSTGNPGMATAGSGDVLTGILTGLLAQSYQPEEAALLGVFLHGLAGDLAVQKTGMSSLMAGDLTDHLGAAFTRLSI